MRPWTRVRTHTHTVGLREPLPQSRAGTAAGSLAVEMGWKGGQVRPGASIPGGQALQRRCPRCGLRAASGRADEDLCGCVRGPGRARGLGSPKGGSRARAAAVNVHPGLDTGCLLARDAAEALHHGVHERDERVTGGEVYRGGSRHELVLVHRLRAVLVQAGKHLVHKRRHLGGGLGLADGPVDGAEECCHLPVGDGAVVVAVHEVERRGELFARRRPPGKGDDVEELVKLNGPAPVRVPLAEQRLDDALVPDANFLADLHEPGRVQEVLAILGHASVGAELALEVLHGVRVEHALGTSFANGRDQQIDVVARALQERHAGGLAEDRVVTGPRHVSCQPRSRGPDAH
mmetsp:Transcript_8149/g.32105  ORF Transcript_8149/g.32105 Transcript_8149/m.32105 type:complete len:347 (-) Transcript_8149:84-1124(-)